MKSFALIGHPVAHSISPAVFRAAYGGAYVYDLVDEEDFDKAWGRFLEGYDGINVTAPFKTLALERADCADPLAQAVGAANVVVRDNAGTKAYNTDVDGVLGCLREAGVHAGADVLVVGYGGAGKAAAAASETLGCRVSVANRTSVTYGDGESIRLDEIGGKRHDAVIYCLPVPVPEISDLRTDVIIEANYRNPSFSKKVMERMKESNPDVVYVSGKRWHLHQAVAAFGIFTGKEPDIEKMLTLY